MIRLVQTADGDAIAAIYRPIVENTFTSFEIVPPDGAEMTKRFQSKYPTYPWLVFELDHQVVGYAYAGPHRSRFAYQWSVETSVYVHAQFHRRGIARALYNALFALLKEQGFINAYAGVALPNEASVGFHESFGFQAIGVYRNVGFKKGQWRSVGWWEMALNEYLDQPKAPLTLSSLTNPVIKSVQKKKRKSS